MGSSPKTKADYKKKIALIQRDIALLQAAPKSLANKNAIASKRARIAELRAKMVDAPSK